MKKHLISALAVATMAFFAISSGDDKKATEEKTSTETAATEKKENWEYSESEDKMDGKKFVFASSKSTNKVELKFPYDGGTTMEVNLRNDGKENEVILTLDKGSFMASVGGSQSVKVKFDDQAATEFSYGSSADGDTKMAFLNNSQSFIKKIKASKKVMIEVTFFQQGSQIFEFNTEGLKWEK
jgi:hypothetical protein